MTLDSGLVLFGIALEVLIVAILFRSRLYRTLPVFAGYMVWCLLSDCWAMFTLTHSTGANSTLYLNMFRIEMPLDAFIQFAVFVELAWSALRPFKSLHPVRAVIGLAILIAVLGLVLWPVAGMLPIAQFPPAYRSIYHLSYTISILRVTVFVVMAAFSQLLSLSWRNRELQVATGLGFYSLASLGATMIHSHQTSASAYHLVDLVTNFAYFLSLVYWASVFLKSEAPRQEFSPEMQRVLLKVARASHVALQSART